MIAGNAVRMTLAVVYYYPVGLWVKIILPAQVCAQLDRLFIYLVQISGVGQAVFAYFKTYVAVIRASIVAASAVPAPHVPRQNLIGGYTAVLELADKGMRTYLLAVGAWSIPVISVDVFAKQSIVRADISFQIGIVCSRTVHHYSFNGYLSAGLVAVVICKYKRMKVHSKPPLKQNFLF